MVNPLPKRFADKVDFSGDCWLWTASKLNSGYGQYKSGDTMVLAHRYAWEHFNGKIPRKLFVLHKCDVKACVNPAHHFLGTQLDNMNDMDAKGRRSRLTGAKGEKHVKAKLTHAQVDEIRRLYRPSKGPQKSEFSQKSLAKKFGVSHIQIGKIVNNKLWKS